MIAIDCGPYGCSFGSTKDLRVPQIVGPSIMLVAGQNIARGRNSRKAENNTGDLTELTLELVVRKLLLRNLLRGPQVPSSVEASITLHPYCMSH